VEPRTLSGHLSKMSFSNLIPKSIILLRLGPLGGPAWWWLARRRFPILILSVSQVKATVETPGGNWTDDEIATYRLKTRAMRS
jgi:hypothetical protein